MRRVALAALLAGAALPAAAQDRPPIFPTRDVAVTYRVLGEGMPPGGVPNLTMAWQAASQLMRTDIPGVGWAVADQRSGRAFMVMEQMRAIMELPLGQAGMGQPPPTATFRREGPGTVAGHSCTNWAYRDGADEGRLCVTAEGVMLRVEGNARGRSGRMEAVQVSFGPQDPARFRRPEGYQAMQGPPGGQRPPGR